MELVYVAIGGAIGAASRYLLSNWIQSRLGATFPWGTFVINVSGSFLIGIVLGLVSGGRLSSEARLFLAVGILGGYTTFSTFSYETLQLISNGDLGAILLYTVVQVIAGLAAVYLGIVLARIPGGT